MADNANTTGNDTATDNLSAYKPLLYPADLGTNPEYGSNKVVFFINVVGNGAVASSETGPAAGGPGFDHTLGVPNNKYYTLSQGNSKPPMSGGQNAVTKAAVAGSNISPTIAALVGKLKLPKPYRRLAGYIALYMPEDVSHSYSVQWQEKDMADSAFKDRMLGSALNMVTGETGFWQGVKDLVVDKATEIGRNKIANSEYLQAATAMTPGNSKAEQLFNGVDFREFEFSYTFAPKSREEAENVLSIIRTFRYHMLPEYLPGSNEFLFLYPSEFDVRFYTGTDENPYIEQHATAVLTRAEVNYTPNNQFNTFSGMNGMASQINLRLSFKEISLLTKETSPADGPGL